MHTHDQSVVAKDDSNLSEICQVFYHIAYIVLCIWIFILAIGSYLGLQGYGYSIQDFKENWETSPLIDIDVSESECPKNYENLITRKWPGTVAGCDCSNSYWTSRYYGEVYKGSCDDNQTEANCRDVRSIRPIPLPKFYSYRICGLRGPNNFATIQRPKSIFKDDPSCPINHKMCGKGETDTIICIPNDEKCPINDILILSDTDSYNKSYSTIDLDDGYKIAYTTEGTGLPVVRLRLTEGRVCSNPNLYEKDKGRSLYELINTDKYGTCHPIVGTSGYDPRYDKIGSIDEYTLFEDNGVNKAADRYLPRYTKVYSPKVKWNLYSNRYYYWSLRCDHYSTMSRSEMISIIDDVSNVANYQKYLMIISIFQIILCGLIIEGLIIAIACSETELDDNKVCKQVSVGIKMAFACLQAYFFWTCYKISDEFEDSILSIKQAECSTECTNKIFSNYGTSLLALKGKNMQGFILTICSIIIILLFFGVIMCNFNRNRHVKL